LAVAWVEGEIPQFGAFGERGNAKIFRVWGRRNVKNRQIRQVGVFRFMEMSEIWKYAGVCVFGEGKLREGISPCGKFEKRKNGTRVPF
jgi:hypothetical protein